jgi:hypothetical protein
MTPERRAALSSAPRPRRALPLVSALGSRARQAELATETRDVDRRDRPAHAVWELTLRCDLACRHCARAQAALDPTS